MNGRLFLYRMGHRKSHTIWHILRHTVPFDNPFLEEIHPAHLQYLLPIEQKALPDLNGEQSFLPSIE